MGWFRYFRRQKWDEERARELETYLNIETEENIARGMPAEEARYAARRKLGNLTRIREEIHEMNSVNILETLWQDVHYGLRMLRKNPGFTAVAILTLALGIGANTAIFSLVNAVLLRPLPFAHPEQLVRIWDSNGVPKHQGPISYPNFVDWRNWNHSFSGMAVYYGQDGVLKSSDEPSVIQGMAASASLFELLGVQPALGRRFLPEEDQPHADNGTDAIIVSHSLWQEHFSGDPHILGKVLTLGGAPFTVVGVMPRGFQLPFGGPHDDFWVTAAGLAEPAPKSSRPVSEERTMSFLSAVARLKPGTSMAQAQADMNHVGSELMRAYPKEDMDEGVTMEGLQESVTSNARLILLVLLGVVGLVLLIACANVGGLLLARATGRRKEMAIRGALGAGRARIVTQLLIESLLLAAISGAFGFGLAATASAWLEKPLGLTGLVHKGMDAWVWGFTLLAALATAVLFGLAPALDASKTALSLTLRETGSAASQSRLHRKLRSVLVIGQLAFTMILLTGAGLLTRSLIGLLQVDSGFRPDHVLTFMIGLSEDQYNQKAWAPFCSDLLARIRALPGVESASAGSELPLQGGRSNTVLDNVAGREIPLEERRGISYSAILPQHFQTLGTPLREGREFTAQDTATSQPVVIINEAAAHRYFGTHDPLGQQIAPEMWNGSGSTTRMRIIVGVVGNTKMQSLNETAFPMVYWPLAQVPSSSTLFFEIHALRDPLSLVAAVRGEVHTMDKDMALTDVWPMDYYLQREQEQPRYSTLLVALFAGLALILSAIGLYAVMAHSIAQRTQEIGIRLALGARRSDVMWMVLGYGAKIVLVGVAVGSAAALGLAHLLTSLLFGIKPIDPLTFAVVAGLLGSIAIIACYLPARRAMRVDPIVALRYE